MSVVQTAISPLRRWTRRKFERFLQQQVPAQPRVVLNRKKIFILPTTAGLGFLFTAALVWLAGTNYENNLVLGLAYLLAALFVITILHTYSNLSGLALQALEAHPTFVGDDAEVTLRLARSGQRWLENIELQWPNGNRTAVSLLEAADSTVKMFVPVRQRGWANPGRLRIESRYPLGLLRAWSLVDLDVRILVYPKPLAAGPIPPVLSNVHDGVLQSHIGGDDFDGYKAYQPGDSLKHVDWKHYARGHNLQSKYYTAYADQQCLLEWEHFTGLDREARLSRLCDWVLTLSKTETEYGLKLPGIVIKPAKGLAHKQQALAALALFEWDRQKPVRGNTP